jgi:hypothetical protein
MMAIAFSTLAQEQLCFFHTCLAPESLHKNSCAFSTLAFSTLAQEQLFPHLHKVRRQIMAIAFPHLHKKNLTERLAHDDRNSAFMQAKSRTRTRQAVDSISIRIRMTVGFSWK